jgi:hypothetical protein
MPSVFVFLATPVLLCLVAGGQPNRNELCLDHLPARVEKVAQHMTFGQGQGYRPRHGVAWLGTARHSDVRMWPPNSPPQLVYRSTH